MINFVEVPNIKITKAENGRGWFLDIKDVIFEAPLTAQELLDLGKCIESAKQDLYADLD